jgi:hypothetical protein
MSIYGTTFSVGFPEPDQPPGIVLIRDDGTNHYPSLEKNRRGALDGAVIPSWCVPGHQDNMDGYEAPGGWYRLSGSSWRIPEGYEAFGEGIWSDQEYLLDEDAARVLRDDLTAWLDLPKTRP